MAEKEGSSQIKLMLLRGGDYPGLYGWDLNATIFTFIRGSQREISHTDEEEVM